MTTENQATQQQDANLTITDLALMKEIIDLASARAAFKPTEMTAVGQVYTKLTAFLDGVAKQQSDTEQAATEQAATEQGE